MLIAFSTVFFQLVLIQHITTHSTTHQKQAITRYIDSMHS